MMDHMHDRMEIVKQLREQQNGVNPRQQLPPQEESLHFSFKVRCFLAFMVVLFAFSMKSSLKNEIVTKVISYLDHNTSIEEAVDSFGTDVSCLKDQLMLY